MSVTDRPVCAQDGQQYIIVYENCSSVDASSQQGDEQKQIFQLSQKSDLIYCDPNFC